MQNTSLKSDALGLVGAATLGVVMLSPAMTLYANFGAAYASAGHAAPMAFVWGLLATLPTAASYALLSREKPAAGSAAAWTALVSPGLARWVGWMAFAYYVTNFVLQPVTLGLFGNDLLAAFGVHTGTGSYVALALLCCAFPAWVAYRGISTSTNGALGFLLFETAVVVALCVAVAWKAPHLDVRGFTPTANVYGALVFAMLSYCGFDVVSTLAEEARMARSLIPRATFASLLAFGALMIAGVWALSFAPSVDASDGMPISRIAAQVWGRGSLFVTLTGISAALGIAIATAVGASRVLFSMARDGLAPAPFAELRAQVPANAMHLVFLVGLSGAITAGIVLGPYQAYLWWGTITTFFAMITFIFVNLANFWLLRERGVFLHVALPLAGIAVDLYLLVRSFFLEGIPSAIVFCVLVSVCAGGARLKRADARA